MPTDARVIEIVERAYDVEAPTAGWLQAIRDSAERAFPVALAVQAYTFAVSSCGRFSLGEIASDSYWGEVLGRAHDFASAETIRNIYLTGPLRSVYAVLAGKPTDPGYEECRRAGIHDVTLALALDPSGSGCALVLLHDHVRALSRPRRLALERVAAHIAAARRLRDARSSTSLDARDRFDAADAILSPTGDLLHACDEAAVRARTSLRDAARRIDCARAKGSSDPIEALSLWRALVEGRWSLVERFDSDGRRFLVAHRNDPVSRADHSLTEREAKVVALLALGHSMKLCAYELGRAESTVSGLAGSAMRKMGVRSRAELVELHGAVVGTDARAPPARAYADSPGQ